RMGRLYPEPGDLVLACCGDRPVWLLRKSLVGDRHLVAAAPDELEANEVLRHHIRAGRFLGLLPLVHFLRQISGDAAWVAPPLRASFIIDDPNLHFPSYGYVHYRQLAEHARRYGYHVSVASIPLDFHYVHPVAAGIFRDHPSLLSLTVHGN